MATSKQLRANKEQHKPKNKESREDENHIQQAMNDCVAYLKKRFPSELNGYRLAIEKKLLYAAMIANIKHKNLRTEFDSVFAKRAIKPDGGVIWLIREDLSQPKRLVLVSETKKQGTNKARLEEGKAPQSQGNAIERLGKNLTGIKAMMNHEQITPFVCFGWGCDFTDDHRDGVVMGKLSLLNEFYKLNKIHVHKRDGDSNRNRFSPVSMFFREQPWSRKEMFEILKEVAEDAIRYYLH